MGREVELRWLIQESHERTLAHRSIENTIQRDFFERLWIDSSDEQIKEVKELISSGNKVGLVHWMKQHSEILYGEMSLNQLRKIGQKLRIKNYCRLDRITLQNEIEVADGSE